MEDFDSRQFRDALGDFPTGVGIATTTTATGEGLGITVSSFNAVSLTPPLVLFSVARNAKGFDDWLRAEHYAINLLHQGQDTISSKFGRAAVDKWDGVEFEGGVGGVRVISDALATFQCKSYAQYDGGDHVILVGQVISLTRAIHRPSPLVFFRGAYRMLEDQSLDAAANSSPR